MANFDVVVVGSCVQDLVSYAPRFPRGGESVRGSKFVAGHGGKGANQAVQAALLGARTAMVGMLGDDLFGRPARDNMIERGVNCDDVHLTCESSTGTATITVNEQGENSIVIVQGANDLLDEAYVDKAAEVIRHAKVLCCQLEIPEATNLAALKMARAHGVATIFNPAPAIVGMNVDVLEYADIVCPNENEAEFLTNSAAGSLKTVEDAVDMASRIREMGARTVIVTLGKKGCVIVPGVDSPFEHVPCPVVTAVDTTGAGDSCVACVTVHRGSFVGSLATLTALRGHLPLAERVRRACAIASRSVQRAGTQASYVSVKELPDGFML